MGTDWINDIANFSAGFGDTISGGLTNWIRNQLGSNSAVDKCSGAYSGGKYSGYAFMATSAATTAWVGGLYGGANSVFWSGFDYGAKEAAASLGTTIEKTLIGRLLDRGGKRVPAIIWKLASRTFANNAKGAVKAVIRANGNIWSNIEKPILLRNGNPINYYP